MDVLQWKTTIADLRGTLFSFTEYHSDMEVAEILKYIPAFPGLFDSRFQTPVCTSCSGHNRNFAYTQNK